MMFYIFLYVFIVIVMDDNLVKMRIDGDFKKAVFDIFSILWSVSERNIRQLK